MIYYLKIIRPVNLMLIFITFYALGAYLDFCYFSTDFSRFHVFSIEFFLFSFSIVLSAAGGNVINDYVDVETDKINRPEKQIVRRFLSEKEVLVYYLLLNFLAFTLAFYVGIKLKFYWIISFVFITVFLLFLYSKYFKKTLFFGNFVVALLTAFVPFWVGLYYQSYLVLPPASFYPFQIDFFPAFPTAFPIYIGLFFAVFAFALNFIREMVKDVEDSVGDAFIGAKTLPVLFGKKTAILVLKGILILCLIFIATVLFIGQNFVLDGQSLLPFLLIFGMLLFCLAILFSSPSPKNFKRVSLWIKWTILFGILMPLFWIIIKK